MAEADDDNGEAEDDDPSDDPSSTPSPPGAFPAREAGGANRPSVEHRDSRSETTADAWKRNSKRTENVPSEAPGGSSRRTTATTPDRRPTAKAPAWSAQTAWTGDSKEIRWRAGGCAAGARAQS